MAGYSSEGQAWTVQHTRKEIAGVWGSEGRLGAARVPLLLLHSWLAPSVEALAPRTRGGLDQSNKMMPMMRGRADDGVGEAVGVVCSGSTRACVPTGEPALPADPHGNPYTLVGYDRERTKPWRANSERLPKFRTQPYGRFHWASSIPALRAQKLPLDLRAINW